MLEVLAVGLIVAVAAVYTAWSLTPAATRARAARRLGAWGRMPGRSIWLARATGAVERAAVRRLDSACGNCSAAPQPSPPQQDEKKP
jgi:uncharacterized membrane protein YccC